LVVGIWSFRHHFFFSADATFGASFSFFGGTIRKIPPWACVGNHLSVLLNVYSAEKILCEPVAHFRSLEA